MKLIRACAIADTSVNKYYSDGYKATKKNETLMRKEIDRLNKEDGSDNFIIIFDLIMKSEAIQTFDPLTYKN